MNKKGLLTGLVISLVIIIAGIAFYLTLIQKSASQTPAHLIPSAQIARMEALMKQNGKSLEGLQAYRFEKDEIGQTHIRFYVYVKGIRADETIYHFNADGTLSSITNEFDASLYSNLLTTPKITADQAIQIAANKIKNSSLIASKEFWNKNIGNPGAKDIVLAWRVNPNNSSSPYAIIDAETGEIIYFDDGIRY
jgi:Zn-dependent metalloprotease